VQSKTAGSNFEKFTVAIDWPWRYMQQIETVSAFAAQTWIVSFTTKHMIL